MCIVILGFMLLAFIECSITLAASADADVGVGVAALVFGSFQLIAVVGVSVYAGIGLSRTF